MVQRFMKRVIIHTRGRPSTAAPLLVESCAKCLYCLLNFSMASPEFTSVDTRPGRGSSEVRTIAHITNSSDSYQSGDATSLPVYLKSLLSVEMMETDVQLLHALSGQIERGIPCSELCYAVQMSVLQGWEAVSRIAVVRPTMVGLMADSVVGLARQSSTHALQMLIQQSETSSSARLKQTSGRMFIPSRQHSPMALHGSANVPMDRESINQLQLSSMLLKAPTLQLFTLEGVPIVMSGESGN